MLFLCSISVKAVSITVANGEEKTLTGTTVFQAGDNILVEAGGVLILDNANLTTNDPNVLWEGITVLGTGDENDQPPATDILNNVSTAQGVVIMKNGSIIENAIIGVNAPGFYNANPSDGSIVIIDGALESNQLNQFLNNNTAIVMENNFFPTVVVTSYIRKTGFYKKHLGSNTLFHLSLTNMREMVIEDNEFVGDHDAHNFIPFVRGINVAHSSLRIENNTFDNLIQGIVSTGAFFDSGNVLWIITENSSIFNNEFKNVVAGIVITGGDQDIIEANTFDFTKDGGEGAYCMFVVENNGFDIVNNVILNAKSYTTQNDETFGIAVVTNLPSGMFSIRENQFKDTNFGLEVADPNTMLQVTCNQFGYDGNPHADAAWAIVSGGSMAPQGDCNPANEPNFLNPAGNEWNYGMIDDATQQDIVIEDFITIPSMFYSHHTAQPGHFTEPRNLEDMFKNACTDNFSNSQCSNLMNITNGGGLINVPNDLFISFSDLIQLPVGILDSFKIEVTGGKIAKTTELESIRAAIVSVEAQLDNGNTVTLVNTVNDLGASQNQLTETLGQVEYLSTDVQKEVIDRIEPLSSNKLREVFIPQAPLDKDIITDLENRDTPVATAVLDDIKMAHTTSGKINLISLRNEERQLLRDLERLDYLLANILRLQNNETGLIDLLNNSIFVGSKVLLLKLHLSKGNWVEAQQALVDLEQLATIEEWNEFTTYVDLFNVIIDINESKRGINGMTNAEVATVEAVANAKQQGAILAEIILHKQRGEEYIHPIPRFVQSTGKRPYVAEDLELIDLVELHPNPANNFVTLNNRLGEAAVITLYDTQGRPFYSQEIGQEAFSEIEVIDWENGSYFYTILTESGEKQTGKLIILK